MNIETFRQVCAGWTDRLTEPKSFYTISMKLFLDKMLHVAVIADHQLFGEFLTQKITFQ